MEGWGALQRKATRAVPMTGGYHFRKSTGKKQTASMVSFRGARSGVRPFHGRAQKENASWGFSRVFTSKPPQESQHHFSTAFFSYFGTSGTHLPPLLDGFHRKPKGKHPLPSSEIPPRPGTAVRILEQPPATGGSLEDMGAAQVGGPKSRAWGRLFF